MFQQFITQKKLYRCKSKEFRKAQRNPFSSVEGYTGTIYLKIGNIDLQQKIQDINCIKKVVQEKSKKVYFEFILKLQAT